MMELLIFVLFCILAILFLSFYVWRICYDNGYDVGVSDTKQGKKPFDERFKDYDS